MASAPVALPADQSATIAELFDPMNPAGDQTTHISDVFGFDPDEGGDDASTQPQAKVPPVADAGASVGAEGEGGASTVAAAPPEPTDAEREAALAKAQADTRIAELEAKIEALAKPAEPKASEPSETSSKLEPLAPISITLPDQLREMLLSEEPDEMVSGITQIINSLATQTRDIGMTLAARLDALEAATTQSRQVAENATVNNASETMRNEYYTDFPAHKAPEFQPIIAAVAAEMAVQLPSAPWNADYRKALGARVADRAKKLAALMNGGSSTPPPALPGGTRSAGVPAGSKDLSDEITDLLSTWDT